MSKILVIGGSKGIGQSLVEYFNADSVSRTNGYDITKQIDRSKIADLSLEYDVVVNHAYTSDNSQLYVLQLIIDKWISVNKKGILINTGSISTYRPYFKDTMKWFNYTATKTSVDSLCYLVSKKCQEGKYNFRITNIKPGMLDTIESRNKQHFTSGVSGVEYCKVVELIINMPEHICIPEIAIESKD